MARKENEVKASAAKVPQRTVLLCTMPPRRQRPRASPLPKVIMRPKASTPLMARLQKASAAKASAAATANALLPDLHKDHVPLMGFRSLTACLSLWDWSS